MTMMLVIRGAAGEVINIGPWDDRVIPDPSDPNGPMIPYNPLPAGATEAREDVTVDPVSGRREVTAEIRTDADKAERRIRKDPVLLALGRMALGDSNASENAVVAAVRAKLP